MRYLSLAVLLALGMGTARADYLSGATGFTTLRDPVAGTKVPGVINFAVLDQKYAKFGDSWATQYDYFDYAFVPGVDAAGAVSPRLDVNALYIYLYQTTNDGITPMDSSAIRLVIDPSLITSWGTFRDLGFADNPEAAPDWTPITATHHLGLDDPSALPGEPSFKVYYPRVVKIATEKDPGLNPFEILLGSDAVRASWVGGPALLGAGRRGTIWGFTSNYPPGLKDSQVVFHCGHEGEPPCPK